MRRIDETVRVRHDPTVRFWLRWFGFRKWLRERGGAYRGDTK